MCKAFHSGMPHIEIKIFQRSAPLFFISFLRRSLHFVQTVFRNSQKKVRATHSIISLFLLMLLSRQESVAGERACIPPIYFIIKGFNLIKISYQRAPAYLISIIS